MILVKTNLKNICHLENISSVEWGLFYGKLTQLGRVGVKQLFGTNFFTFQISAISIIIRV